MWRTECSRRMTTAVLCLPMLLALGCQTGFRKQTHASQRCLSNDPRYTPVASEFKPSKQQLQALEEYKHERQKQRAGLADDAQ